MCFEKHIEDPARKVKVKIEQENIGSPKQSHFLTVFAIDLADRILGEDKGEPISQPKLERGDHTNEFYIISFSGTTRLEPKELRKYLTSKAFPKPLAYTTVDVNYASPKAEIRLEAKP